MNTELINAVERRMQFIVTLNVFYATFTFNFFKFTGSTDNESVEIFLKMGAYTVVYIICYVAYYFAKEYLSETWLKRIDFALVATAASLIYPILIFGIGKLVMSTYDQIMMLGSLGIYMTASFALLVMVVVPATAEFWLREWKR